jgi:CHAT domain-containing protein
VAIHRLRKRYRELFRQEIADTVRVAGARNVVMTLWPVDDDITRRFMHQLYAQRLGQHAALSSAAWNASRILLRERRTAHLSTHPWYWAGFVSSGTLM